jgi:16S rRNA (guanine1207-N2)-methyltransferase
MMVDTLIQVPQGTFQLLRFPIENQEKLRAWDAADEYLLNEVATQITTDHARILLVNDHFGALAVALHKFRPSVVTDSYIAQVATQENLRLNQINTDAVQLFDSINLPAQQFDYIFIKAPKTLAFFEDLLLRLQKNLTMNTQVIVAGMVKNMPNSIWQTLARLIGATTPSKAVKKARLIYATPDAAREIPANPYPTCYQLEATTYQIYNHANVFSRQQLDIGTRFFLQHLPEHNKYQQVIDLGCGNGVVGLIFAAKNPAATMHFIDESFMAVASARQNFKLAFAQRHASFKAGDALADVAPHSVDLILCNPPFHQQNTIGNHIAMRMFKQAAHALSAGGELWVIGNRHLGYQTSLKRYFSQVELVATNAKFIIIKAANER